MVVPFVLFLVSVAALAAALVLPGLSDLVLLAGPCVVASLYLLLRLPRRRRRGRNDGGLRGDGRPSVFRPKGPRGKPKWILVDGSNVLHWREGTPQIDTLREVVAHLAAKGYTPGVVFDANAGYLVAGRYQHDFALGKLVGLPADRVLVAPKGTPADTLLLQSARDLGARIVTNDRYRDWAEAHPEVREQGFLIKGAFRDTGLWLDLEEGAGEGRSRSLEKAG